MTYTKVTLKQKLKTVDFRVVSQYSVKARRALG